MCAVSIPSYCVSIPFLAILRAIHRNRFLGLWKKFRLTFIHWDRNKNDKKKNIECWQQHFKVDELRSRDDNVSLFIELTHLHYHHWKLLKKKKEKTPFFYVVQKPISIPSSSGCGMITVIGERRPLKMWHIESSWNERFMTTKNSHSLLSVFFSLTQHEPPVTVALFFT